MLAPKTQIFKTGQYTHSTINKKRKEDTMATPKQKFSTFEIQHRTLFNNVMEYLYDTIADDDQDHVIEVIKAFQSTKEMIKAFQSGYTLVLLGPEVIEKIETLKEEEKSFVICIMRGVNVYCIIADRDCLY